MVDVAIAFSGKLIGAILEMKKQKAELNLEIQKILILATGIQKGLYFYKNLAMLSEDQSIKNLCTSLEDTTSIIDTVKKRNCLTSYLQSAQDLQNLRNSYSLVEIAFDAIQKTAKLAESGQLIKNSQGNAQLNQQALDILTSKAAQDFWKQHVKKQQLPMPINDCGDYFKSFIAQYNETEEGQKNKLKLTYLEPVIAKIIDTNHTGYVELKEIEFFFSQWWNDQEQRQQLKNKLDVKIGESHDEFLFVYQMLRSVNCEQYFPLFKFNGIDGKYFIQMNFDKLKACFSRQITEIELSKISNCIEQFKFEIQDFENLKAQCIKMKLDVDKYRNRAIELRNENKLKKVKMDLENIKESYFEFSNGSGHTYLVDFEGSEFYGYSHDFKPVTPFFIQYCQDDHEVNYAHLTKDYQEYFGLYYAINQDLENPFQLYADHTGSQQRNDIFMKIYREDKNGKQLGCNIINKYVTLYEVPIGQQIYIDLNGRYMIRYFEQGVEVSYDEFQQYKDNTLKMDNQKATKLMKEQNLFLVELDSDVEEELEQQKCIQTEKIKLINKE